ncbi:MAG: hypothetical protein SPE54_07560 [Sodaliphilus sp.]|nr:hypothetical protein [Sodaliphilus sp.]
MGGREVSRPYQVWFFAEANGFYPFSDATDLVRGRRWFVVYVVCLKSDLPQH